MIILGYKSSFLDNEIYGAEDVSRIFSHIVSNGVVLYPENTTVPDALTEMTAEITTDGVSEYKGLMVTKTDNGIKIDKGVGFFESGVCVEVDADGVELETESGTSGYVCFIYEPEFNRVRAEVSALPPEGDVLVLAQVLTDGSIIDMREFARSKIIPSCANYYHDFTVTHSRFGNNDERDDYNTTYYQMPNGSFRYLLLHDVVTTALEMKLCDHIIDLNKEGEQGIKLTRDTTPAYMKVLRTGNELRIASIRSNKLYDVHTLCMTLV